MPDRIAFPEEGLSDGTFRIRKHRESDIPAMVEACQDPSIPRYTRVPSPYTDADARGWIEAAAAGRAEGSRLSLLVVGEDSDELAGSVGLHHFEWDDGRAEVGYWVAPWARRRGVATAAVALISRHAFEELGIERLSITAEAENEASVRVAERAGFRREGILRGWMTQAGARRDMVMLGLLRADATTR